MEIVYYYCEATQARIPFYSYAPKLFSVFVKQGGVWNQSQREFIFKQVDDDRLIDNARLVIDKFPDIVCVFVRENSIAPFQVYGFSQRAWWFDDKDSNFKQSGVGEDFSRQSKGVLAVYKLSKAPEKFSEHWRAKLEEDLRSRKYSPRTLRAYLYYNALICRFLQKPPEEIHSEDIVKFLAALEKQKDYSSSSLNLAISAIKFFYKYVLEKDYVYERNRPKHDRRLPMILSKAEISKILSHEKNLKHRLLLMLAYSSGLRVSEVVNLKKEHIDISRGVIHVEFAKGRKDRCTILSQKAALVIAEYLSTYDIQTWLFPGQPVTKALSIRSAQKIFDKAVRHAEIHKKLSIHSLRHSFATHLIESGTDIRYIQTLLGHSNLRTTERYTHIAQSSVLNIRSPLDTLL